MFKYFFDIIINLVDEIEIKSNKFYINLIYKLI